MARTIRQIKGAERNAARRLLASIREKASFLTEVDIKEIDYIDPFDIRKDF